MYFPRSFNLREAIEAARLVLDEYRRFEAFQRGDTQETPAGYELVRELSYHWPMPRGGSRAARFLGFGRIDEAIGKDIPIGVILRRGRTVFLVFRGTMTAGEWFLDASAGLDPNLDQRPGMVHDGFLKTYSVFRSSIVETVRGLPKPKRIVVTGHSLGAALASLSVPDVAANAPGASLVAYTFGSPRAGDAEFAAEYEANFGRTTFRVFNTSDLVVAVPPPVPIKGIIKGCFTHVGMPVPFTRQNCDAEQNHIIETYLDALESERPSR